MPWSRSTVASAVDADNELRPKQEQPVRNSFPAPQKTKYDKYNPFLESTAYRVDVERPRPRRSKRDDNHRMSRSEKLRYRKDPIARRWPISRKRFTAATVCVNTALMGLIIGIYAGMVPRIQFQLADQKHYVLFGNIVLYLGLAFTTFICWPLPLLHGRKPYTLAALALLLPLQFPQAILVHSYHSPVLAEYEASLLLCRFLTGMLLGLANINLFSTMLDLYGSSLMSHAPHQEIVILNDVRREGGGLGLWLGIWTWCFTSSISVGFVCGAGIIFNLNPEWGFYITGILMAFVLVLNILTPETRRVAHRRSFKAYLDADEKVRKKLVKGEIKLHIHDEGPSNCFQEVWAGMVLCKRMFMQKGFCVLSLYLGWIYGQNVLLIVLIGALLSVGYDLPSWGVGLGVASIAIGSLLAVPLTKGGLFSRARKQGPRSDSDTYKRQVTWSSHLVRRVVFMVALPIFGIAYTLASPGMQTHYMIPIVFAGFIGFLSNLAITECHGLIMETFDTCDLQPGVNSRHRLQSLSESVIMRRTAYTSYPRVSAGIFLSQTIGFIVAALATGVGGYITRHLGAQISTGATAVILMMLTILLTLALWRYKSLQVIPDKPFGVKLDKDGRADEYWKPVVIGNPSGKTRKMSLLEMGGLSRWSEIRKLNKLVPDTAARK
ncbi:MFS general substrate transporter [Tothia fuscella]|uniref:MFS general substrate transporter n=1 Tax=Tothia fuscella TaxID=1048955 RepID=A0A9P4P1J5_9PEZI|nr:MFS general substrate transporter [Tothia fuscella]